MIEELKKIYPEISIKGFHCPPMLDVDEFWWTSTSTYLIIPMLT